jgi:hypothetical protein
MERDVPLEWLIPPSMPIELIHLDGMPVLVHKPGDLERKEEAIKKFAEKIKSGKRWPHCYFATLEGEDYLHDVLGADREDSDHDLVSGWFRERLEPRILWLPKIPSLAEAIRVGSIDWSDKKNWEPVKWDQIDSHLELLDHPQISERLRESLIRFERWKKLGESRKHARVLIDSPF